ncbi:TonB-dependent receptor [Candidatus Phycosocius spiralis]|uniref:TonB-dependent receptor n=1 Tax=Candidatus Phycosocius spiralis TaxID=2815099 RepID=A0ABQ4PXP1_9PROT|nr:TonB-dependent receptor [Candidatus Phycosocius spiralis]GIU67802.1 TonB-dependent receptor [Candidatus Phycosocius spiralis]
MVKYAQGIRLRTGVSVVALMLGSAGAAYAQSTPAAEPATPTSQEVDTIVVRGYRASVADALTTKRNSNLIIESITAQDIGEFPDKNIAESLQRLPGVQIDRENGQGTKVRIRGLDQNVVVLNNEIFLTGLELFRIGEGNFTQTDSLEGVPSDLIGGVDVYKSPQATLLEGGLGGIINLRTRSARTIKDGFLITGQARANQSENGETTPSGSLTTGYRVNDRFAILASVSYDKSNVITDALGGDNRGNWRLTDRPLSNGKVSNIWSPEYRYITKRDQDRERLAGSINVDFRLTDTIDVRFDWFHSNLTILTKEASLKFPFANENATYSASNLKIGANNVLESGTITANSAEGISFVQNGEAKTDNFQLSANWEINERLSVNVGAYQSQADYESTSGNNDVRYTQYGVRNGTKDGFIPNPTAPKTLVFDYINGEFPTFRPATPSAFTTPTSVFAKSHWVFGENSSIENTAYRADFTLDAPDKLDGLWTVHFGLRTGTRKVDSEYGRYLADYSGKGELSGLKFNQNWTPYGYFQDGAIGFKSCELPVNTPGRPKCSPPENGPRFGDSPALITPYQTAATNPNRFETVTVGGITALFQNRDQMKNALDWIKGLYPSTPFAFYRDPISSFKVEEKTNNGYLMLDVGRPSENYHINAGVRVIQTELTVNSSGSPTEPAYWGTDSWNGVLMNPVAERTVRDYTDVLPSVNAIYNFDEANKVRGSLARVVARQNLFQLGQGSQYDFTRVSTPGPNLDKFAFTNGSGGNPKLDPFRADQADLTLEHYFGRQGLVSVGVFYKSIDSFIQSNTVARAVKDGTVEGSTVGAFTQPTNGEGGSIQGVELSAQYDFSNGFGFTANYTYSDSKSPYSTDYEKYLPIPGVSKNAFNVTGYFEKNGYAAHLSYAWRDKALVGTFGFDKFVLGRYQAAYGQLDGQLAFDVTENFQITLEGSNLTGENATEYLQFENLPFRNLGGVTRFSLGGKFKFGS